MIHKHNIYEKHIPHQFTDTLPDELIIEPKFSFGIYPHEGRIKVKPLLPHIIKNHSRHESRLIFFRFDKKTTDTFKLDKLYYCEQAGISEFKFTPVKLFTPLKVKLTKAAQATSVEVKVKPTSTSAAQAKNEKILPPSTSVELFFLSRNDTIIGPLETFHSNILKRIEEPIEHITIAPNEETKDPRSLLETFNEKALKYFYKFSWEPNLKRYTLEILSEKFALSLSKSLASILGFDPSKDLYRKGSYIAQDSPILHRNITGLYVYTNIINAVHVGDVKAPLLLTCPFKRKGSNDIVDQQEFLNPTYTPINRNVINQIDIGIYDDAGTLIPFLYGKTKLSLHFRRRK